MKVNIAKGYHARLYQQAFYAPILVGLTGRRKTGLAMRVRELFSFRREGLPITVRLVGYQGREGVWLVAVAVRIATDAESLLEGIAYLNPRQADDYHLLHHLAQQEGFPLLFLNDSLKVGVGQEVVWSVHNRQQVRVLLHQLDHVLPELREDSGADADFSAIRQEFHARHSVQSLLAAQPHVTGVSFGSSFRGVVLE